MGEKTEEASPKKLRDARKKGQIAKSQDAPAAFTFVSSIAVTIVLAPWIFGKLSAFVIACFSSVNAPNVQQVVLSFFTQAPPLILSLALPVLLTTATVGVLVNFLLIGPVFAMEAFKPDIKKFNPIDNIKGKFKMKTLVELIKQLLKISGAVYLIWTVVEDSLPLVVSTLSMPMISAVVIYSNFLLKVIFKVGLFFLVVGVFDFWYQKRTFMKSMMMEKHEVKQEYKNSEGDPQIKGKRKQIAQEIAFSDPPQKAARKSKAIITNPIHIAVAIGYDPEKYPLPYICAMGQDVMAQLILREAEDYNIPVLRNVSLARQLYEDGDLWNFVPTQTYEAIAEVLKWVQSLENKDGEDFDE